MDYGSLLVQQVDLEIVARRSAGASQACLSKASCGWLKSRPARHRYLLFGSDKSS